MFRSKTVSSGLLSASCAALLLNACGGGGAASGGGRVENPARDSQGRQVRSADGGQVSAEAHSEWRRGVDLFARYEREGWNDAKCEEASETFEEAVSAQGGRFAEALYMAGLSLARCNKDDEARSFYTRALEVNQKLCKARVGIGVGQLEANRQQEAYATFQRALADDPQCTEAYVNIAIIQRQRGGAQVREALNNLRRALAIDSRYLPAFNQMALLYLEQAADNQQMLDLAGVVCRQAQQIDRNYAPIYNTWGLINVRKGSVIEALRMFEKAMQLDRSMFEAFMNFGQITLSFRGYEDAKNAFQRAVELRPRAYEAHIGLGAALRGLQQVEAAKAQYEEARTIDGARPEAYFNLGILYQDYMSGGVQDLDRARTHFQEFLQRAGGNQKYAQAVEDVRRTCRQDQSQSRNRRARRRSTDCRPGRLQNIETAAAAMRAAGSQPSGG